MYLEEISMYKKDRATIRSILPLDIACEFPVFAPAYLAKSPYYPIYANVVNDLLLPATYQSGRRLAFPAEFARRFSLYTSDVLAGISWTTAKSRSFVCGSAMTATAIINPLEQLACDNNYVQYIDAYYPYKNRTKKRYAKMHGQPEPDYTLFDDADSAQPSADEHPTPTPIPKRKYSDIDLAVECAIEDFEEVAQAHIAAIKAVTRVNKVKKIPQFDDKYKYIVVTDKRAVEIFQIKKIESIIVRFHLGCVRAWYDGKTVHCFPSFIIAAMHGVNVDVRWMSNNKDPRDTILTYFQRGFGTVVSRKVGTKFNKFLTDNARWKPGRRNPPPQQNGRRAYHLIRMARRYSTEPLYSNYLGIFTEPLNLQSSAMNKLASAPKFLRFLSKTDPLPHKLLALANYM
jgi:hypothetical protein